MKHWFFALCTALLLLTALPVTAIANSDLPRVVDEADLLTDSEESDLADSIAYIADMYACDVVILTVDSLDDNTPTAYADDYFDYNDYGYNDSRDGILFLLSMEDRDWAFSTRGEGIVAFTDYGLEQLEAEILSDLSDGNYYDAFSQFLSTSEYYLECYAEGTPFDVAPLGKGFWFAVVVVVALILALVITGIEKASMKSVRKQAYASDYLVNGSFVLNEQSDLFLYSTTTRTKKSEESKSGSSTHTSSSGSTHGGSSGKF